MITMNYKVFGTKPDGTMEICRAKAENRGTGRCPHGAHEDVSITKETSGYIQQHNESVLSETFGSTATLTKSAIKIPKPTARPPLAPPVFNQPKPNQSNSRNNRRRRPARTPKVTSNNISTYENGLALTRSELLESAQKVADQFTEEDWKFVQGFYGSISHQVSEKETKQRFGKVSANVSNYLKSDDPTAQQTREFLGDEVDIDEFSHILTNEVRAMTLAEEWRDGKTSIRRVVLSALDNDMTKERYVSSVMFFGGRCCYCNTVLRKSPPAEQQASGEHLTPVTPNNPKSIHGGTRYGNMALACVKCNGSRGNKEMVEWIQETDCIPEEDKPQVLGRIQAFRKFTLYHEYTPAENNKIIRTINSLNKNLRTTKNANKTKGIFNMTNEQKREFKKDLKVALYDLRHQQ